MAENSANNRNQWKMVAEGRARLATAIVNKASNTPGMPKDKALELYTTASNILEKAAGEQGLAKEKKAHALMMQGYCLQRLGKHPEAASSIAVSLDMDNHHRNRQYSDS